jgi:hypothetical protein
MCVNIKEGDIGGGECPDKSDRVATVDALKEQEKWIMAMNPQEKYIINKPEPKVRFGVFWVQEILIQRSHEEINIGGSHPGLWGFAHNLKVMGRVKGEVVGKDEVGKG